VVAPLLGYTVGSWAPFAMAGIVVLAYAIGAVVRFNIHHLEPLLDGGHAYISFVERLSNVSLATAYLISVAFMCGCWRPFCCIHWQSRTTPGSPI
jgi:hypothetical protein